MFEVKPQLDDLQDKLCSLYWDFRETPLTPEQIRGKASELILLAGYYFRLADNLEVEAEATQAESRLLIWKEIAESGSIVVDGRSPGV